jgi:hypothetical protein
MDEKNLKDINTIGQAEKALFYDNPELLFVFKKTQKISYALFMISDLFDSHEPLKVSLRNNATELIHNSLSFIKNSTEGNIKHIDNLISSLFETFSLCEAGYFAKLISEMNSSLLKKEIQNIVEVLDLKKGKRISLDEGFLEVGDLESYKGQIDTPKGHSVLYPKLSTTTQSIASNVAPKKVFVKPVQKDNKINHLNRTDVIMSLVKKGGELTIKDFLGYIKDCSEKTIQRELLALVAKGLLKKKGERRWSRYYL